MTDAMFERYNEEQARLEAEMEERNARILRRIDLQSRVWRSHEPAPVEWSVGPGFAVVVSILLGAVIGLVVGWWIVDAWQNVTAMLMDFQMLRIEQ